MANDLDRIYASIAKDLGVDKDVVTTVVRGAFSYVLDTWRAIDKNEPLTKEEFLKNPLAFKLGSMGNFYPKYSRIINYQKRHNEDNKENQDQ